MLGFSPGCALLRRGGARIMAPAAANLARSIEHQEDLILVRDGAPAFLLAVDALASDPAARPETLVAAAEAYTAYAMTFVADEDQERARTMLAKARDYGLRALARRRAFRRVRDAPPAEFETAMNCFTQRDLPALYITAQAWSSWILNSPGSVRALADFPKAHALMQRAAEIDPDYRNGAIDLFFAIYYTVQPLGAGRDFERAEHHFQRAMRLAGDDALLPRVLYAEIYARYRYDQDLFESVLHDVLDRETEDVSQALMNAAARRRAAALLKQTDDLF